MNGTNDWKLPWEGGCRCGKVRFKVTLPPLLTSACHCTGCQSMSSSAFSLSIGIPTPGFQITSGEPVVGGLHHGDAKHMFCGWCMTWMFTWPKGFEQMFVNLRPTMLDNHAWVSPFIETYTSEKLPWVRTPAVHSFEKFPPMEAYERLLREYAEKGARPGRIAIRD